MIRLWHLWVNKQARPGEFVIPFVLATSCFCTLLGIFCGWVAFTGTGSDSLAGRLSRSSEG